MKNIYKPFVLFYFVFFTLVCFSGQNPEPPDKITKEELVPNGILGWNQDNWVLILKKDGEYECFRGDSKFVGSWDLVNNRIFVSESWDNGPNTVVYKWDCGLKRDGKFFVGQAEGDYGKVDCVFRK